MSAMSSQQVSDLMSNHGRIRCRVSSGIASDGGCLAENERARTDLYPIAVMEQRRLADAATVEERAVAATKVYQPVFVLPLRMHDRVSA